MDAGPVPAEVLAVNERLVDERNQLREALDEVWGRLPVEEVLAMVGDCPDVVELCKANHERVAHRPLPALED